MPAAFLCGGHRRVNESWRVKGGGPEGRREADVAQRPFNNSLTPVVVSRSIITVPYVKVPTVRSVPNWTKPI
jgi:hypothetical protein